jgi:hypothetical protein
MELEKENSSCALTASSFHIQFHLLYLQNYNIRLKVEKGTNWRADVYKDYFEG